MKPYASAQAFPGLPIIFAEGFRDYGRRISGHSHISLAITDISERVRTQTSVNVTAKGVKLSLPGQHLKARRSQDIKNLVHDMLSMAADPAGVEIKSSNHGVVTGSSDSGVAALVTALDEALELNLTQDALAKISNQASETAYRSIYGGLSGFTIDSEGNTKTRKLKSSAYFRDVAIYAIPFDIRRFSADDLHLRVVRHPEYPNRCRQADERISRLEDLLDSHDIIGLMQLMESEAKTVHKLFAEMGMDVIKPEMRAVTDLVEDMREEGVQAFWNVAGGSQVYVFTQKKWAKEVTRKLKDANHRYSNYKVACKAGPPKKPA
jgi:mevalonate pyrophosphate decarboxylase